MGKKKSNKPNPKKYTLETPIVKAYIEFYATPYSLRSDELKTEDDFIKTVNLKSRRSLHNYQQIQGFWDAVYEEQRKYDKHMTSVAKNGLLKRAEGMTVKRDAVDPKGGMVELEEELPPDVSACKAILTIVGDMREKHAHDITSAGVSIFREAAEAEKRGDNNG